MLIVFLRYQKWLQRILKKYLTEEKYTVLLCLRSTVILPVKTTAGKRAGKELHLSENDKVILFFGYVRKYKGLDILIDALPEAIQQIPELKLLIVGEFYDDVSAYISRIERLGLKNNVLLINKFVPNEEVAKYYSAADVTALPYRSATQSAVLNVSYSFGKPVIAARVGGLSEFVKDNYTGIIIEPDDKESLTAGIIRYFSSEKNIDFQPNIKDYLSQSNFNDLPALFEKIIDEAKGKSS